MDGTGGDGARAREAPWRGGGLVAKASDDDGKRVGGIVATGHRVSVWRSSKGDGDHAREPRQGVPCCLSSIA